MEESPVEEADSHSASQEISPLMEPKGSLECSQQPVTGPFPDRNESNPHLPTLFPEHPF
jgi:hypothetical protein